MIADLILFPLSLGIGLSLAAIVTSNTPVRNALIALGMLLLAVVILGTPPFPPLTSKHKIIYLFLAVALVTPGVGKLPVPVRIATTVLFIAAAFFWLNWRRMSVGMPFEPILLSALTLASVLTRATCAERDNEESLPWVASLFVTTLSVGFVGLLSGFLGIGQLAVALGVFIGGVLVPPYVAALAGKHTSKLALPPALPWVTLTALGLLGISLASFATNLHPFAYCLLLIALLSPLIARRIPKPASATLRPILFGCVAALPASGAVLVAYLHF